MDKTPKIVKYKKITPLTCAWPAVVGVTWGCRTDLRLACSCWGDMGVPYSPAPGLQLLG